MSQNSMYFILKFTYSNLLFKNHLSSLRSITAVVTWSNMNSVKWMPVRDYICECC